MLLDDVAALARLTAASVDDVAAAAGRASAKAAGVVVDDAAVTPRYVQGLDASRELSIIGRIAKGSLRNKLLFILPAILLLSQFLPWIVTPILMVGGAYLSYEGAHKVLEWLGVGHHDAEHDEPAVEVGPEQEQKMVSGAIRTDFILSAEIMVIALREVAAALEPHLAEALAWGLVERVAPAGRLDEAVRDWLGHLGAAGRHALRRQKRLIRQWEDLPLREAVAAGIPAFAAAWETEEPRRMLGAFRHRREGPR